MKPHKEVSWIAGMTALVFPRYALYSSPRHNEPQAFFHSKAILLLPPQTFSANETATGMWGNTGTYATRGIVRARGRYGVGWPTARSCGAIIQMCRWRNRPANMGGPAIRIQGSRHPVIL